MHKRCVGWYRPDRPPRPNGCPRKDAVDAYAPTPRALIDWDEAVVIRRGGTYFRGYVESIAFESDKTVSPPNGPPTHYYGDVFTRIKITRPDPISRRFAENLP